MNRYTRRRPDLVKDAIPKVILDSATLSCSECDLREMGTESHCVDVAIVHVRRTAHALTVYSVKAVTYVLGANE